MGKYVTLAKIRSELTALYHLKLGGILARIYFSEGESSG